MPKITPRDRSIARMVSDWHCHQNMANDKLVAAVVSDETLEMLIRKALDPDQELHQGHPPTAQDALPLTKTAKFKWKCPKGAHKNWHYLPVWWTDAHGETHYTVVECYGSGKKKTQAGGYCKPFIYFDSEAELFLALSQMAQDVMRYRAARVEKDPWE